ncbi:hypothetical protein WR25_24056 [Diploscapter pachys]|uniref:Uncharacterized protein n=1 Tax=Diploscapter pachys TaxID=2018661 RepID=A0A2A2LB32_9BILA|nr:hypothetical protein WR25_24056 [Diploscapter pachys]
MPLYLWISMNEILSAFAICAVFYFFKGINRKFVLLNENDSLADTIDMINAYRILFTHAAVIRYWILRNSEKDRLKSTIMATRSQKMEDHFNSIKQMWK